MTRFPQAENITRKHKPSGPLWVLTVLGILSLTACSDIDRAATEITESTNGFVTILTPGSAEARKGVMMAKALETGQDQVWETRRGCGANLKSSCYIKVDVETSTTKRPHQSFRNLTVRSRIPADGYPFWKTKKEFFTYILQGRVWVSAR